MKCLYAEPTNHLDLEACVWLEETLKQFKRILLLISHSQVITGVSHIARDLLLSLAVGYYPTPSYLLTRACMAVCRTS